jgi:hypothetical protein
MIFNLKNKIASIENNIDKEKLQAEKIWQMI